MSLRFNSLSGISKIHLYNSGMRYLFLLTYLVSSAVCAQALPIRISKIEGQVLYYRERALSILTERTQLQQNDLILTKEGSVTLSFEETDATFSPHSLFRVSNLKNSERHEFGEFLLGEVLVQTRNKLVDQRALEVVLAKAKVQVLGTKYLIQAAQNVETLMARQEGKFSPLPRLELIPAAVAHSDLVTQVTCFEGKVSLILDSGEKQILEAKASALYSGAGANLRVSVKDDSELATLLEGLGLKL